MFWDETQNTCFDSITDEVLSLDLMLKSVIIIFFECKKNRLPMPKMRGE